MFLAVVGTAAVDDEDEDMNRFVLFVAELVVGNVAASGSSGFCM